MDNDRSKVYNKNNKGKKTEYDKEYYESNKEKLRDKMKDYREKNKEKINEKMKEYYEANKEKKLEYQKLYNAQNKEKYNYKIKGECGCLVVKRNLKTHQATNTHLDKMKNLNSVQK